METLKELIASYERGELTLREFWASVARMALEEHALSD